MQCTYGFCVILTINKCFHKQCGNEFLHSRNQQHASLFTQTVLHVSKHKRSPLFQSTMSGGPHVLVQHTAVKIKFLVTMLK